MQFSVLILGLLLVSARLAAQPPQDSTCFLINGQYVIDFGRATIFTAAQPLHFGVRQWATVAFIGGAGYVAYRYDLEINDFLHKNITDEQSRIIKHAGGPIGNGLVILPLLGALYVHGIKVDNDQSRRAALHGMQAFVLGAGATIVLKQLTKRARPDQLLISKPDAWYGPSGYGGYDAFPSGHSLRSFAVATVLAGVYEDKPWVGIAAYSLAGFASLSRLAYGEHWISDVVAGAALGYFVGRGVLLFNRSRYAGCIQPHIGTHGIGFQVSIGK